MPIRYRRRPRVVVWISIVILVLTVPVQAAPKAKLWARWQKHDAQSTRRIDHSAWETWLTTYVVAPHPSGINRVRYGAVSAADREGLVAYVEMLQEVPISTYNRQEQKAYWINLYNALTVQVVLEHYPVESIRDIDISPGLFSDGPWRAPLLNIEGEEVSLDDIEHRILRPIWRDNRLHYALNCASLGCPNLAPTAYTPATMERLLDEGAHMYVNHPRGARFDGDQLYVSSIYVWFKEDFGGNTAGVVQHLRHYADASLAERLQGYDGSLKHDYDWRLNSP